MIANTETRLDQLENLAATTLLAIRELGNRQESTQSQLDSGNNQFRAFDQRMQALSDRDELFDRQMQAFNLRMEKIDACLARTALQQELNAQQIALNSAGIVELRNMMADWVRGQR